MNPRVHVLVGAFACALSSAVIAAGCLDFSRFESCEGATSPQCTGGDDGGPRTDGADGAQTDAPSGAETGPKPPFCSRFDAASVFCDAFDNGPSLDWTDRVQGNGATLETSSEIGAWQPPGLIIRVGDATSDPVPGAYLRRVFDGTMKVVRLGFAIWPDDVTGKTHEAPAAAIAVARAGGASSQFQLILAPSPFFKEIGYTATGDVEFARDYKTEDGSLKRPLPFGRWTRVEMEVNLEAAPRGKVTVDDGIAAEPIFTELWEPNVVEVVVGVSYSALPTVAWSVRYDDVTVEMR